MASFLTKTHRFKAFKIHINIKNEQKGWGNTRYWSVWSKGNLKKEPFRHPNRPISEGEEQDPENPIKHKQKTNQTDKNQRKKERVKERLLVGWWKNLWEMDSKLFWIGSTRSGGTGRPAIIYLKIRAWCSSSCHCNTVKGDLLFIPIMPLPAAAAAVPPTTTVLLPSSPPHPLLFIITRLLLLLRRRHRRPTTTSLQLILLQNPEEEPLCLKNHQENLKHSLRQRRKSWDIYQPLSPPSGLLSLSLSVVCVFSVRRSVWVKRGQYLYLWRNRRTPILVSFLILGIWEFGNFGALKDYAFFAFPDLYYNGCFVN